jgi:hypothetical protein
MKNKTTLVYKYTVPQGEVLQADSMTITGITGTQCDEHRCNKLAL